MQKRVEFAVLLIVKIEKDGNGATGRVISVGNGGLARTIALLPAVLTVAVETSLVLENAKIRQEGGEGKEDADGIELSRLIAGDPAVCVKFPENANSTSRANFLTTK